MSRQKACIKRLTVVGYDYLDGIMMATVSDPGEWDETAREIDVAVVEAFESEWDRLRDAEKALIEAWGNAPDVPNPKYEPPEDTDDAS